MYRKGVSALIINKEGEFLLVNLESFEERYYAVPGGGLEEGETLEEAVYREIHEELGIEKCSLELINTSSVPLFYRFKVPKVTNEGETHVGSERNFFGFRFIGNDNEIKVREGEVRAYKWVSFNDLKDYLLFDDQLDETIQKIKEIFHEDKVI